RLPRIAIVAGLYLTFVAVVVVVVLQLGPTVQDQLKELGDSLPHSIRDARAELIKNPEIKILGITFDTQKLDAQIDKSVSDVIDPLRGRAVQLLRQTLEYEHQVL